MVSRVYLKGGPKHGEVVLLAKEDLSLLFFDQPPISLISCDNRPPCSTAPEIYEYRATGRVSDTGLRIFEIV